MSNQTVKFKVKYEISVEGASRKFPGDEKSSMEKLLDNFMGATVISIGDQHKTLKINYKKIKEK